MRAGPALNRQLIPIQSALNVRASASTADAPITVMTYDLRGLLVSTTDPVGQTDTFEYDGVGRKTKWIEPAPYAGLEPPQTTYEYDLAGNLITLTQPDPDGSGSSQQLHAAARIEMFYLDDSRITDEGLARVSRIAVIEYVSLNRTRCTDVGIRNLARCRKLATLRIDGTDVRGECFCDEFDGRLRVLSIRSCPISAKGTDCIANLHSLEFLDVSETNISCEDLMRFAQLPHLKCLVIERIDMSHEEYDRLRSTNSAINIVTL